ncbi:hypothetical protein O3M35_004688 [Rhynocoris fuscipes]|uniref:Thioredoxin domain-containing protein 9 n=1 Tax=Rhynocoris fuscipes TaxID=488301 RepID=A0AAW1CM69_9HEMI
MSSNEQCEALVKNALNQIENHIDSELERFNDLESIRKERLKAMKKEAEEQKNWFANDHGTYYEVEEKQFFEICKKSKDVVIHFFNNSELCKIFDHHLLILAKKHFETRFIKINSEKAPFLKDRLVIKTIPTILLIKDNKSVGKIVGLSRLDNTKEFGTNLLEWRLAQYQVIRYDGDLSTPPGNQRKETQFLFGKKCSIRQGGAADDDDFSDD